MPNVCGAKGVNQNWFHCRATSLNQVRVGFSVWRVRRLMDSPHSTLVRQPLIQRSVPSGGGRDRAS